MKLPQGFCQVMVTLSLGLILLGGNLVPQPAWASMEDAAIFYDELKDQGEWVDYGNYGPVWYPSQVQENWRPYTDGRWTPSEEGYVFETQEPWAPSTYHYGNWMPTSEYGWVWVPGRTWYPNTVAWRTSPESAGPDESYIGWAPIPPPDYTPAPGYYPPNYSGTGSYGGGLDSLLTAPFWIFARAASFLLGFSSPYSPSYSYWGSNCLVPIQSVPYYYTRTVIVNNYYSPTYYPAGHIVTGGYYNWGPPIPYVSRVTRIRQANIDNYMRQTSIYQRRNVVPAASVLSRRPYFRDVLPPAMLSQQPLSRGTHLQASQVARANLVRPNLVNANMIKNPPRFTAAIPKAQVKPGQWGRGVPGAPLPTDQQRQRPISNIPASRQNEPVSPRTRGWTAPTTSATTVQQSTTASRPHGPEITAVPGRNTVVPYGRGSQTTPPTMTPGPGGTTATQMPPGPYQPRPYQPGPWGKHEQTPQSTVTPGRYPGQRQMQTSIPNPPSTATFTPQQRGSEPRFRKQSPTPSPSPAAPFTTSPSRPAPVQLQPLKQTSRPAPTQIQRPAPTFRAPQAQRQSFSPPQQVQRPPQPQMHQQTYRQPAPPSRPQSRGQQRQPDHQKRNQQN